VSAFAELHEELRSVARDVLARVSPLSGFGPDAVDIDPTLLAGTGWFGLEVPESLGGAGAGFAETVVVLEEVGRVVARTPLLGSAVLGVGALNLADPGETRDQLLRDVAPGQRNMTVALPTGDPSAGDGAAEGHPVGERPLPGRPRLQFRLEEHGGDLRLHGSADYVPDAVGAQRILALAADPTGVPVLVDLPCPSPQVRIAARPVLDITRRLASVEVSGAVIDESAVWQLGRHPGEAARELMDRGALAVAVDSLGAAQAILEATVHYAGTRRQFGRPIGSFQAVKHACADMLVKVSVGRELVNEAVAALGEEPSTAWVPVARAKSFVCEAAVEVAGKAMQLHGGIGYTWESGIHLYLKRAALNRSLFGSPRAHRRRLATRYL
jgi:alkylation response protein AidB-like acyl-CoA dehydrogenase